MTSLRRLPYPPPWQDAPTLCAHLSISEGTIDNWVRQGLLPPARPRGGKRMWKWAEVERWLDAGGDPEAQSPVSQIERIRNATRQAASR